MLDVSRVQKELVECNRDKGISGVSIVHDGRSDLSHLSGTITGPVGTPYEGGTFQIDICLPSGYPFEPPKMQFITKVWLTSTQSTQHTLLSLWSLFVLHPNISSQNGAICLDILKDQWSPALTLKTALLSLQALLSAPEPDDPQDAVVAQQYLRDYPTFVATARYWTEVFAKRTSVGIEEKVQKLVEMGFPEDLVRNTLESVNGDENMALEKLCSG
ncbi:ubiquitin-conjugating enzyme E2 27 isoform X1 [Elaeis guineensis]|uniref:Ubiquitin-conjugating enzyme E2 27 isoform X1 n=1 Tax=Elaeis guineensis var. tenera TaxID=51953 RepID=A0A6I9QES3_ELAGV|nr:ubiquitin-conjugating enzyme E2 27 isoform X1 [Elaeis guineensis]